MIRAFAAAAVALLGACHASSPPAATPAPPNPELSPALAKLAWWPGLWTAANGTEEWIAASGALFGIALHDDGTYEVMIVDDAPGPGPADGIVRFYAMPDGASMTEFRERSAAPARIEVANDEHDFPKSIAYVRTGDALRATIGGDGTEIDFAMTRGTPVRAPELEAADRAFSDATSATGVDGWVAAFAPDGAMMTRGGRVQGATAIHDLMADTLSQGALVWAPIASGKHGDLGYTVGKATYTPKGAAKPASRSAYTTLWKRQPDGSWKVLFDVGRVVNE